MILDEALPRILSLFVVKFVLSNTLRVIKLFRFVPLLIGPIDLARFDVLFGILIFKPLNRRGKVSDAVARPSTGTNLREI